MTEELAKSNNGRKKSRDRISRSRSNSRSNILSASILSREKDKNSYDHHNESKNDYIQSHQSPNNKNKSDDNDKEVVIEKEMFENSHKKTNKIDNNESENKSNEKINDNVADKNNHKNNDRGRERGSVDYSSDPFAFQDDDEEYSEDEQYQEDFDSNITAKVDGKSSIDESERKDKTSDYNEDYVDDNNNDDNNHNDSNGNGNRNDSDSKKKLNHDTNSPDDNYAPLKMKKIRPKSAPATIRKSDYGPRTLISGSGIRRNENGSPINHKNSQIIHKNDSKNGNKYDKNSHKNDNDEKNDSVEATAERIDRLLLLECRILDLRNDKLNEKNNKNDKNSEGRRDSKSEEIFIQKTNQEEMNNWRDLFLNDKRLNAETFLSDKRKSYKFNPEIKRVDKIIDKIRRKNYITKPNVIWTPDKLTELMDNKSIKL